MRELRDAWSRTIKAEDYEAHMAAIGQAQANAALVAEYLQAQPPSRHASLLFAGAGTGQMFEYVPPEILLPFNVTFTDINAGYLNHHEQLAFRQLAHVEWRAALATLCKLTERELFVVIQ